MKTIIITLLLINCSFGQTPKIKQKNSYTARSRSSKSITADNRCREGDTVSDGYYSYNCGPNKTWVQAKIAQEEKHRKELLWALQRRVLTDAEMNEVEASREALFSSSYPFSYDSLYIQKRLNEALLQQFRLRQAASHKENCSQSK